MSRIASSRRRLGSVALAALTAGVVVPADAFARTPPPRCLTGGDSPRLLRLVGDELQLCLDDGSPIVGDSSDAAAPVARAAVRCYAIDLATRQISLAPSPPFVRPLPRVAAPPPSRQISLDQDGAELCDASGKCKTLRASGDVDPGLGVTAAVNQAGTLAALAYLAEQTTVEVFDLATGAPLAQLHGRDPRAMCITAELLDRTVLVRERDCGRDAVARAWLADAATGRHLAEVGGARAFAAGAQPSISPAHLAGDDWAFTAARGAAVVIQDVRTGKVKKRLSLGARATPATPVSDGKRLVIAYEGRRLGDLAVVDLTTYKVTRLAGQRCSK
jgi:hypothetical protein